MFEAINDLIRKTNAESLNLTIKPNSNGTLTIISNAVFSQPLDKKADEEAMVAKEALMKPMITIGIPADHDANFEKDLAEFTGIKEVNTQLYYSNVKKTAEKGNKSPYEHGDVKDKREAPAKADTTDTATSESQPEPKLDNAVDNGEGSL